jgi:hypothetical protein
MSKVAPERCQFAAKIAYATALEETLEIEIE